MASARENLAKYLTQKMGFHVSWRYDQGGLTTTFKGGTQYKEFEVVVPVNVLGSLKTPEVKALAEMLTRGWTNMQPEIFIDVNTNRIGIRVPYLASVVDEIKAFIPPAARTWDSSTKTWYVNASYLDTVERIIRKAFPTVKVTTPEAALPVVADGDAYGALLRPLPDNALRSVYKAIAISCHPDRAAANGLTVEQANGIMQAVNIAWAEVKKARGWS